MQSNNPIFRNSKEFNGQANAYGNQTYPGNGSSYQGYGQAPAYGGGAAEPAVRARDVSQRPGDGVRVCGRVVQQLGAERSDLQARVAHSSVA